MTSSFVTALDRERRVRIMFHMSLFGPILTVKGGIGIFSVQMYDHRIGV
jgi:hypothetical protein